MALGLYATLPARVTLGAATNENAPAYSLRFLVERRDTKSDLGTVYPTPTAKVVELTDALEMAMSALAPAEKGPEPAQMEPVALEKLSASTSPVMVAAACL